MARMTEDTDAQRTRLTMDVSAPVLKLWNKEYAHHITPEGTLAAILIELRALRRKAGDSK